MSFDRPEGLWLLALAVPILAFHFYRGRIRRLPVPTLLFWEQILVEEERISALRRLRHYASLLLNLLALSVLTSAVSEPRVRGLTRDPVRLALVVDTSPPMLAREPDGRSRLDRAREEARTWLDSCDGAALYDGQGLVEPFTDEIERVRRSLGELRVRPRSRAEEIVSDLRRTRPDLRVVFLAGGAPTPNRGWTEGVCVQAGEERFPTVRLRAARFGAEPVEERIVLRWNGEVLAERSIRGEAETVFEFGVDPSRHPGRRLELGGVLEAAFASPDAFPLDDVATFVVPPSAPPPVIVFHAGKPDPVLSSALEALASRGWIGERILVSLSRFDRVRSAIGEGTAVILDRCAPPEAPSGGSWLQLGAASGAELVRPVVTDWDRSGPLFDGVELTSLAVQRARLVRGGRPLIETASGPIATVERRAGLVFVALGFSADLAESDFALRAAFPLFLRNWFEWIRRGATRAFPTQASFGDAIVPEAEWLREGAYRVVGAQGESAHPVRGGEPIVPLWPGAVRISAEGREEFVAVNFFDSDSSDLARSTAPASDPAPLPRPWFRRIPYAVLAAAIVLALLLLEWFLYHRGWI